MALDNTADWIAALNIGAVPLRRLPDPDADDMDTQAEQSTLIGFTADITPAAPSTDTGNTQDDILIGYAYAFAFASAMQNARTQARGRDRGKR